MYNNASAFIISAISYELTHTKYRKALHYVKLSNALLTWEGGDNRKEKCTLLLYCILLF